MPLWLCNSLVLTSVTKLKKRNEIICHEISLKKPIFNWEFSFQQPIFLRVKICRCLLSWGCYDPSIFFFCYGFPGSRKPRKKHETASLTLTTKKGGWWSWIRGLENSVFWLFLVGGREVKRGEVVFQDDTVIPGWVITTMGVGAWCFSLRKPKVEGVWGICESDLELICVCKSWTMTCHELWCCCIFLLDLWLLKKKVCPKKGQSPFPKPASTSNFDGQVFANKLLGLVRYG